MKGSPVAGFELGLNLGGQQGVAESNPLLRQLQDRRGLRRAQMPEYGCSFGDQSFDDCDGRLAEQSERLQHLMNLLRQRRQTRRDELGQRGGNAYSLARTRPPARPLERAPELECVERDSARGLVKLDERRSRQRRRVKKLRGRTRQLVLRTERAQLSS